MGGRTNERANSFNQLLHFEKLDVLMRFADLSKKLIGPCCIFFCIMKQNFNNSKIDSGKYQVALQKRGFSLLKKDRQPITFWDASLIAKGVGKCNNDIAHFGKLKDTSSFSRTLKNAKVPSKRVRWGRFFSAHLALWAVLPIFHCTDPLPLILILQRSTLTAR